MKPLNGNSNDKGDFGQIVCEHIENLQGVEYIVADSALYTEENIKGMAQNGIFWITRVPQTISQAKEMIQKADKTTMTLINENYLYQCLTSDYADVDQRWVLFYSKHAQIRAKKSVNKQIFRESEKESKAFRKLCRQTFLCFADAELALKRFQKMLKFL